MGSALASVLLAFGSVGGMDIDRFGWGDMKFLCGVHGPGLP
jgi:hypothetical protein